VVKRGRQALFGEISQAFLGLLDVKLNLVRPVVTVAREADEALRTLIKTELETRWKKEVLPIYQVAPEILGRVIIRLGDRVLDSSVQRRMVRLRSSSSRVESRGGRASPPRLSAGQSGCSGGPGRHRFRRHHAAGSRATHLSKRNREIATRHSVGCRL
jgi:hypothetical protein